MHLAVYGTWEALVGCKMLPQGVGTVSTLAETLLENVVLVGHLIICWRHTCCKQQHMCTCIGQTATTKLTVWTVDHLQFWGTNSCC